MPTRPTIGLWWPPPIWSRQFYGKAPSRRYIVGGSNGGRAGLVAIQRYPEDYDGVLALEPAISQEGFAANLVPEMLQHIFSSPDNWMNESEIRLFEQAELEACDALDGLADGILGNVRACHYDGQPLRCKEDERDSDACLTEGQLESVRRILADKKTPVTLADGVVGYPGYGRGAQSQDWVTFIFGPSFAARTAADYMLADNIVKHGITNDPNASVMTHDPTKWAAQYLALSNEIDATDPDLSAFHRRGGRLIVWFGLSDYCVTYKRTADYLDSVTAKMGAKTRRGVRPLLRLARHGSFDVGPRRQHGALAERSRRLGRSRSGAGRAAGHAVRGIRRAGSDAPALSVSLVPALRRKRRSQGRQQLHLRR